MTYQTLTYDVTDRVAVITFATPDALNSISETRLTELEDAISRVEADHGLGALILTGLGRAFCVGLDLDLLDRAFGDIPYFERVVRRLNDLVTRLEALPIPTIAAVNGFARAGGFELTLGCDFIIVGDQARIGDVHTDAGVLPACASLRLARRIGDSRAKDLLFSARWLKGQEAVDFGLANACAPQDELLPFALAFAARYTDKPRATLAAVKHVFQAGGDLDRAEAAEFELRNFAHYMGTEPYGVEGYRAFREGRQPAWKSSAG